MPSQMHDPRLQRDGPVPDASTASARGPFFRQCSRLLFQCFFQIGHDVCRTLAHHKYDFSAGQRFDQRALGNLVLVGQIVFKRLALRGQLSDAPASFRDEPKPLAFALGCLFTNVLARPQFIAYGPGKKPWTARLAEAMGAIRVCWTVRPEDDINAKEAENDAVIFEFYHPAPQYK